MNFFKPISSSNKEVTSMQVITRIVYLNPS